MEGEREGERDGRAREAGRDGGKKMKEGERGWIDDSGRNR